MCYPARPAPPTSQQGGRPNRGSPASSEALIISNCYLVIGFRKASERVWKVVFVFCCSKHPLARTVGVSQVTVMIMIIRTIIIIITLVLISISIVTMIIMIIIIIIIIIILVIITIVLIALIARPLMMITLKVMLSILNNSNDKHNNKMMTIIMII